MALTRKYLKALEIDEDKIEQIIEAHTEVTDALKADRDKYKAEATRLPSVQKELDDMKAEKAKADPYKEKYEKEHEDFEAFKKDIEQKQVKEQKVDAYKALLKEANVSEQFYDSILNVTSFDELELDPDGKLKDADKATENIKSKYAGFIVKRGTEGAGTENPPHNVGGSKMTKADIYKRDEHGRYVLSTAERQKALMENMSNQ